MKSFSVVILAAGVGKRMKSKTPKVMHNMCGRPMLFYVVDTAKRLKPEKIVLVVGKKIDKKYFIGAYCNTPLQFVVQDPPLGTGDAVLKTESMFKDVEAYRLSRRAKAGNTPLLILCGDVPLLKSSTLRELIKFHYKIKASATVLTAIVPDPSLYGRIIRRGNKLIKIVEDQDASPEEKEISEINSGIYVFEKTPLFEALQEIKPVNAQKEYYLTDTIEILRKKGLPVSAYKTPDYHEVLGINTRRTLTEVENILQDRIIENFQLEGVTVEEPETTHIDFDVQIGKDTLIHPRAHILGNTKIGKNCEIGAGTRIRNSKISPGTIIGEDSSIENAQL
ncbi:bifunctional N-acetylglucosamine-1-phosphate uridyltransferase/glucosamine-1-phosphate acetyltransferase [candidate division WOR-3 bacterium]|nr:bifunctional N-acetylglucosamine-1-phosphate uridyltransferase/glucosamine-1-phosphate acetyltransferase [candidate division WOR-3 bacterium]